MGDTIEDHDLIHCLYIASQQAGIPVWIYDIDTGKIESNNNADLTFPLLSEFMNPEKLSKYIHPDDSAALHTLYTQINEGQASATATLRWRMTEQTPWRYAKIIYTLFHNSTGNTRKALGAAFDVSSIMEAELMYTTRLAQLYTLTPHSLGIFHLKLQTNVCLAGSSSSAFTIIEETNTIDAFFTAYYDRFPYAEELIQFKKEANRRALLSAFKQGKTTFSFDHRLIINDTTTEWVTTKINIFRNPLNNTVEAILYIVNCNTEKTQNLITSAAINNDYDIIVSIDIIKNKSTIFYFSHASAFDTLCYDTNDYNNGAETYFRRIYCGTDIERIVHEVKIPFIREQLENKERYTFVFPVKVGHKGQRYKRGMFTYLDKVHGLVCFTRVDVTNMMCAEKEKTAALALAQRALQEKEQLRISEETYRIAVEQSDKYLLRYDITTKTAYHDFDSRRLFNFPSVMQNMFERSLAAGIVAEESIQEYTNFYHAIEQGKEQGHTLVQLKTAQDQWRWIRGDFTTIFSNDHVPLQAIISLSDITEQRERDIIFTKWKQSIEEFPDHSYTLYESNLTSSVNDTVRGSLMPAILSSNIPLDERAKLYATQHVHPEDREKYLFLLNREKLLVDYYKGIRTTTLDFREIRENNTEFWIRLSIELVQYPDSSDIKIYLLYQDIDEEKKLTLLCKKRIEKDPLTNLLNRATFIESFNSLLKTQIEGTQAALIIVDIDNFKHVNDTFGHVVGDRLLIEFSNTLRGAIRSDDLLGRLGGDEFTLCFKNITDSNGIQKRAATICQCVRDKLASYGISASLGIALFPAHGDCFKSLYACADLALYAAKRQGRNCFVLYHAGLSQNNVAPCAPASVLPIESILQHTKFHEIVEQNKLLLQRQEEDDRYRIIMETMRIITFEWNFEAGRFFSSDGFSEYTISSEVYSILFKYTCSYTCIHPDDKQIFYTDFLKKLKDNADIAETIVRLSKKDGTYQLCRIAIILLRKPTGKLCRAIGTINAVDMAAEEARFRLEALMKYLDAGVILLELGETIQTLYTSPGYLALKKRTPEQARTHTYGTDIIEEDRKNLLDMLRTYSASGKLLDTSYRCKTHNKFCWYHLRAIRIPYEWSKHPVMLCVITDITTLKEHEQTLATINSVVGIFKVRMDKEFTVLYGNDRYYNMHGYSSRDDMRAGIELKAIRYIHPLHIKNVGLVLQKALAAGKKQQKFEMQIITKQGNIRWILTWGALLTDSEGATMVGCVLDITDIKNNEQHMQEQLALLNEKQSSAARV